MRYHLYFDAPSPPEYLELVLCRDVYHCTPNELADVPLDKVLAHLICIIEEDKWRESRGKT